MSIYTEKMIEILSFQEKDLQATFYYSADTELKTTLLYFHGGGFIFGSRKDLPHPYIQLLTSAGIGILAVDYPLAPEIKLPTILEITNKTTKWVVDEFLPHYRQEKYFIMGRSAGAFLALTNGVYANQLDLRPSGIISLYGYFNLNDASFTVPNRHYLKYPKIDKAIVSTEIKNEPLLEATAQNRYLIYLAARQKGNWPDLFLPSTDQKQKLSIQKESLKILPPLFIGAATKDPDIPVRQSRQLANIHTDASLNLFDIDEHDFDRTHLDTLGMALYEKITSWILEQLYK